MEEVTGRSTPRAAGVGVQARREGCAEITSGRSAGPAGGGPTCPDSLREPQAQRGRGPRTGTSGRSSEDEEVMLLERRACGHSSATGTASRGRVTPGDNPLPREVALRGGEL